MKEFFFSVYHTPGYICDALLLKCLTSVSVNYLLETPSVINHLVYNKDEIIYFLYIFILIYIYTHTHTYIYYIYIYYIYILYIHYIYFIYSIYLSIYIYLSTYLSIYLSVYINMVSKGLSCPSYKVLPPSPKFLISPTLKGCCLDWQCFLN